MIYLELHQTRVDLIEIEFDEEGIKVKFIRLYKVFVGFYKVYATGRLVTIIVQGEISAVKQAVEAAAANALKPCIHAVIPNPHEEIRRMVEIGARKNKI